MKLTFRKFFQKCYKNSLIKCHILESFHDRYKNQISDDVIFLFYVHSCAKIKLSRLKLAKKKPLIP